MAYWPPPPPQGDRINWSTGLLSSVGCLAHPSERIRPDHPRVPACVCCRASKSPALERENAFSFLIIFRTAVLILVSVLIATPFALPPPRPAFTLCFVSPARVCAAPDLVQGPYVRSTAAGEDLESTKYS